jgi:hypothetical protein
MQIRLSQTRRILALGTTLTALGLVSFAFRAAGGTLSTTLADFDQPGTQPGEIIERIAESQQCAPCHGNYNLDQEPYRRWAASMMAQSTRDPIFHAALAIAEQDADFSGALCLRCHAPGAYLEGRHVPTDGSGLDPSQYDYDGVTCNFCHRMVDPIAAPENPSEDASVIAALSNPPTSEAHSGQFIVDEYDRRRGPFDLGPTFFYHPVLESPFHRESLLCANCHDVSNPALSKQPDGSYQANALGQEHPTHDKRDEFPIERTYSEWANSVFALADIDGGGLEMDGRFGENQTAVATCQDCHLPAISGEACAPGLGPEFRDDMPRHDLNGANSWVLRAVRELYPDGETGLSQQTVDDSIARNVKMLQTAADLEVFKRGDQVVVRIVNQTGHKLPTGYGEGRRMWINVQFRNAADDLTGESGQYLPGAAQLQEHDTRVYEVDQGLDDTMAALTGVSAGPGFHFVLNNKVFKDNRIPPRGFSNFTFAEAQALPKAHFYREQHYWDDVLYDIPLGTVSVFVRLYHQTTTKEYIDFLRTENTTNNAGQVAYDMWRLFGFSAPVEMKNAGFTLANPPCPTPIPYGLGKLNTLGKRARIAASGDPSEAAGTFDLTLTGGRPNQLAVVFVGNGATSIPYADGFRLLTGVTRGPSFTLDVNGDGSVAVPVDPGLAGSDRYYQIFYRDSGSTQNLGLSDGLYVEFCP